MVHLEGLRVYKGTIELVKRVSQMKPEHSQTGNPGFNLPLCNDKACNSSPIKLKG